MGILVAGLYLAFFVNALMTFDALETEAAFEYGRNYMSGLVLGAAVFWPLAYAFLGFGLMYDLTRHMITGKERS